MVNYIIFSIFCSIDILHVIALLNQVNSVNSSSAEENDVCEDRKNLRRTATEAAQILSVYCESTDQEKNVMESLREPNK